MSSQAHAVREFEEQLRDARHLSEHLLNRKLPKPAAMASPGVHAFLRHAAAVKAPKRSRLALHIPFTDDGLSDINALILDYLTMAGYPNAAARFSTEANLQPQQDDDSITARQQIQTAIHRGDIETAIRALNDLDPEILDGDDVLHFSLLRLQLVELIRTCSSDPGGDITPALEFATQQLGPRAPSRPEFLEDLEKTMTLVVFPHDTLEPHLAALLKPELRREVADKVNKAILQRQTQRREAAIRHLVQMRAWSEDVARKESKYWKEVPTRIDLGLHSDESEAGNDMHDVDEDMQDMPEDGHEPMITT